jgi:hypothetical protein
VDLEINYELLAKYIANECTEEEKSQIERRIENDLIFAEKIKEMQELMNTREEYGKDLDTEVLWDQLEKRLDSFSSKSSSTLQVQNHFSSVFNSRKTRTLLRYAAMLIVSFFVTYFIYTGIGLYPQKQTHS